MSQSKPAPPEPDEIAGRYTIVQKLGAGAFGTVYKAKDRILGRMVAIKTIRLEGLAASATGLEELLERFMREARVSAQLKHPNIVTIYDVGESEGLTYLAMEFIEGVGLEKVIAAEGRLALPRAASIASQVADALDFAHKHNVVHRDIKPANIMIEPGDRVKVTDFGIAKEIAGEQLTVTGSLLGTPSYMSPEQARGVSLDGRSDLFAVGCVLYEMVTGKKAFQGESITGLIFKIITEEPVPVRELEPQVPEPLVRIIGKALLKSPETRYQTGRELARDLLALTQPTVTPTLREIEIPTTPMPVVSAQPTARAAPPPLPTVSGPPTAAAPPTAHVTPPSPAPPPRPAARPVSHPPARPAAGPPPRRSSAGLAVGLGLVVLGLGGIGGAWYFLREKEVATVSDAASSGGARTTPSAPPTTGAPAEAPEEATAAVPTEQEAEPPEARGFEPAPPGAGAGPQPKLPSRPAPSAAEAARPSASQPATAAEERSFLDEEPEETPEGAEAGRRLAEAYRGQQGTRPGGSFGPSGRFRQRERSPRTLAPPERPGVAVLRHVINAQEAFHRKHGRYGTFEELARAQLLFLDVPLAARQFVRKNYRFELTLEEDGYRVLAIPSSPGLRPFVGDESGYIRTGTE